MSEVPRADDRPVPGVKALVLDFGGPVLVTPFERLGPTERRLGLPAGTFPWRGPFDPGGDALWRAMQAGEVSEREYWARRCAEVGRHVGDPSVRGGMGLLYGGASEAELVRPGAPGLVRDAAAAGYRVLVLSNDLGLFHGGDWVRTWSILRAMDAIVDVSVRGYRKPEPAAYQEALDAAGVRAAEALMVDDQPGNTAGARALGMPAVQFDVTDPAAGYAEIRAALDLPPEG